MDIGKGREQGRGSLAYKDIGKEREQGRGSLVTPWNSLLLRVVTP